VGATLPVVVVAAALGALLAVAGVISLVTAPRDSSVAATPAARNGE
jgi:type II secretory pathway component PulJ